MFVTGYSTGTTSEEDHATGEDYATVAYRASTGAQLWLGRHNGPGNGSDGATSVAVSPGGDKVFVTGTVFVAREVDFGVRDTDYATIAYSAATGARLWLTRYTSPDTENLDYAASLAISPAGDKLFVAGTTAIWDLRAPSGAYATVAYNAATGTQLWVTSSQIGTEDAAQSIVVSPGGGRVFVTGGYYDESGSTNNNGYLTIAYRS